jgi:hypothetical protein
MCIVVGLRALVSAHYTLHLDGGVVKRSAKKCPHNKFPKMYYMEVHPFRDTPQKPGR